MGPTRKRDLAAAVLAAAEAYADAAGVSLEGVYPSPLGDVGDEAWTTYARRSRVARPSAVTPDGRHGCYGLTARELAAAGWMLDAHKDKVNGRLCWCGTWAPGHDEGGFLADTVDQYEALAALSKLHARVIAERHRDLVGQEIEGKPATLSGLLGVCRRADARVEGEGDEPEVVRQDPPVLEGGVVTQADVPSVRVRQLRVVHLVRVAHVPVGPCGRAQYEHGNGCHRYSE